MAAKVHLLIIDPQIDFIDTPGAEGALAVAGSFQDSKRTAQFIKRVGPKLDDIHITMDSHHALQVFHPFWWRHKDTGDHPNPFTIIDKTNVGNVWITAVQQFMGRSKAYVEALEASGRYSLCIWPEHCKIGTPGYGIQPDIGQELSEWEHRFIANVDKVTKGSNIFTEHYSAVKAEVEDSTDPTTQLNRQLIDILAECDQVVIAGQASSHCVANTVRDIAANFSAENVKKLVLLKDCMSPVTGFQQAQDDFFKDMSAMGVRITDSASYLV
jgi:nicotinamidase/pyrazinamidase